MKANPNELVLHTFWVLCWVSQRDCLILFHTRSLLGSYYEHCNFTGEIQRGFSSLSLQDCRASKWQRQNSNSHIGVLGLSHYNDLFRNSTASSLLLSIEKTLTQWSLTHFWALFRGKNKNKQTNNNNNLPPEVFEDSSREHLPCTKDSFGLKSGCWWLPYKRELSLAEVTLQSISSMAKFNFKPGYWSPM